MHDELNNVTGYEGESVKESRITGRNMCVDSVGDFTPEEIREIRKKTRMTQDMFARCFGVSKKSVEAWEYGISRADGPARRLLQFFSSNPRFAEVMGIMHEREQSDVDSDEEVSSVAESQNVEYKESWHDEYLRWVCGFANARGGRIYIGIRDDGKIVGVEGSKKLLEDIPNKIRDTMGIISDVNLLTADGKKYIEISVNPSSYPVSYKGEYHYRSGSTKQQLRGTALTEFLIRKTGYRWDAVPVDDISVDELDTVSFEIFRREAVKNNRMSQKDLDIPNEDLLKHLDLMVDGKLKRAAALLFFNKPGRIIVGSYVKVGYFASGSDLQYQDTVEGSLFRIADQVIDLIYSKYLKAKITYEHNVRVETYPFPKDGVREAVYNALCHNDYAASIPIQIKIMDDAMYISNSCILPQGWTVETLMNTHNSMPYNPSIANTFYRAGYIEAWGRGIQKVFDACRELGTPLPEYTVIGNNLTVKFTALSAAAVPGEVCSRTTEDEMESDVVNPESDVVNFENDVVNSENDVVNPGNDVVNSENDVVNSKNDVVNPKSDVVNPKSDVVNPKSDVVNFGSDVDSEIPERDVPPELVKLKRDVYLEIMKDGSLTISGMSEALGVSKSRVERCLRKLKEEGYIVRDGADKKGIWRVIR